MIDLNIGGWQSIKSKLKQVIGVANKIENLTIKRGGTLDSVTFAGDSITIKLQDFPGKMVGGIAITELYAFKVINNGGGTVSVTTGTINSHTATGLSPAGKPTELWLKATIDGDGVTTAAEVVTASAVDSSVVSTRQIATIVWDGDVPTISQGIRGSQNLLSCAASHGWSSLYLS